MSGAKQSVCSSYLDSLPRAAFTSPLKRSESQKLNFVALDWTARRLGAIFGSLCDSLSLSLILEQDPELFRIKMSSNFWEENSM